MIRGKSWLRWLAVCALAAGCSVFALNGGRDQAEGEQAGEECVTPAGGPIVAEGSAQAASAAVVPARMPTARVGQMAPDFEASAYVGGTFKNIKLSDYAGKWVALCFYPGDFTFV